VVILQKYKKIVDHLKDLMGNQENIRNIGIMAHVDHGKTTLSDQLLSGAGMISDKMAGEMLMLDYLEIEQMRQMTVKAANVSLYYQKDGREYAINLIDTPGHIDFTGHVTRSLRVIDGAIVVVDAVEEVMVQTETVTRQALEERVKPLLFINKIDRLIKELRLTPQEVQKKIVRIIKDFNNLIEAYAEEQFKDSWKVSWENDSVALGSALHGWGMNNSISQKKGIKFSDIIKAYEEGTDLKPIIPVYDAILDMVIRHIPSPKEAQSYRIDKIWRDKEAEDIINAMKNCDPNGPLVIGVNAVKVEPQAGIVVTGRVFSGTLREGEEVYLVNARQTQRVQQASLYMGPYRIRSEQVPAGNIVAIMGLSYASPGETVITQDIRDRVIQGFESIKYVTEPVVTVAIEPKKPQDLPKLVDAIRRLTIQDPNLIMIHNTETGEILLKGTGQLHLEIAMYELQKEGLEFEVGEPTVVYRESIRGSSDVVLAKSPNKLNRIWVTAARLDDKVVNMIKMREIDERTDRRTLATVLRERGGMETEDARNVMKIDEENYNLLINRTVGVQRLDEVKELLKQGFIWSMKEGPLAGEPVMGVVIRLVNAMIHEDPAHRGPAQITPTMRRAIYGAMLSSDPVLLEPVYEIQVSTPPELIGNVIGLISQKRGKVEGIEERGRISIVKGQIPVRETLGTFSNEMRSVTSGRAFWQTKFSHWEPMPKNLMIETIMEIRRRKGMKEEIPRAEEFMDTL
jgi:elongation factor 2